MTLGPPHSTPRLIHPKATLPSSDELLLQAMTLFCPPPALLSSADTSLSPPSALSPTPTTLLLLLGEGSAEFLLFLPHHPAFLA